MKNIIQRVCVTNVYYPLLSIFLPCSLATGPTKKGYLQDKMDFHCSPFQHSQQYQQHCDLLDCHIGQLFQSLLQLSQRCSQHQNILRNMHIEILFKSSKCI